MTVMVTRNQSALMRHEIRIGLHTLAADGSVEDGGEGSAPSPHDLYDAALGACKALTVLWYAKRKGIPVESIEVGVERDGTQERAVRTASTPSSASAVRLAQRSARSCCPLLRSARSTS